MRNLFNKPINWLVAIAAVISMNALSGAAFAQTRDNFDEAYYLRNNPYVAAAVQSGQFISGYDHFIQHGRFENRPYRTYRVISNNGGYNRQTNSEWEVRRQINEAYRQVLGRDADAEGTRHYLALYYQGWSLDQIRRDLANSREANNFNRY